VWTIGLLGAASGLSSDYELISSTILTSSAATVTFSSLGTYSSTYKHLQVRYVGKRTIEASGDLYLTLNGSSTGYAWHGLTGSSTTVSSTGAATRTSIQIQRLSAVIPTNAFTAGIIDLLDSYSTTKNKTIRALHGLQDGDAGISLTSGFWANTASVTSIDFSLFSGDFATGSRFSLYGIKG
jgi:hypothetical protein